MSHARTELPPCGFGSELRDAISLRGLVMVLGGLVIQLAFIVSCLGAFPSPTPRRITVAVVAPAQARGRSWTG